MTWLSLSVEGKIEEHEGVPDLQQMYASIGCQMVEVVECSRDGLTMWIDEEGKYSGAELNEYATMLAANGWIFAGDVIMGNVLFTGGPDRHGNTTGLTKAQVAYVRQLERVHVMSPELRIIDVTGADLHWDRPA